MSFLNVLGPVTQFATTAACYSLLRKVEQGPLLCSVLIPAVQAAGSYVYNAIQKPAAEATYSSSNFSSLSPLEKAAAGTFGSHIAVNLADLVKSTYLSHTSPSTAQAAAFINIKA